MEIPSLKHIAESTVLQCVIREDSPCVRCDIQWMHMIRQLDEGAWGYESKLILDRAVKYFGHKLTPKIVHALLPSATKELCLKECPKITEQCLNMILNRCRNLHSLDITENVHLTFRKVPLFCMENKMVHKALTSVILEDCLQVTDEHVQALIRNAPSLQTLNIARCDITDKVFLLNEAKQLAREAGFHLPPLTDSYDSILRNVDVSRNKNITSTGIRHLCTLCGPTLTSVNIAWTMVDCTVLLYLSGLGLPDAVLFYSSFNFMKDPMVDALVQTLQEFARVSELIRDRWKSGRVMDGKDINDGNERVVECSEASVVDHSTEELVGNVNLPPSDTVLSNNDPVVDDNHSSINDSGTSNEDNNASVESVIIVGDSSITTTQGANPTCSIKSADFDQEAGLENETAKHIPNTCTLNTNASSKEITSTASSVVSGATGGSDKSQKDAQEVQERRGNILQKIECLWKPRLPNVINVNKTDTIDPAIFFESYKTNAAKIQPFFSSNITSVFMQGMIFKDQNLGLMCFKKFLTSNENLSVIKLFGGIIGNFVQDNALKLIGEHASNLTSIGLEGCDQVSDVGITSLIACKKLCEIDLTGVAFIEDAGILLLAHTLPLTKMLLAESKITSIALNTIAERPVAKTLKDLDLSWCEELEDDDGLNNAVTKCTSLERLMLRESCITERSLELIGNHCHLITKLSIASNMCKANLGRVKATVQDDCLILLSENLPLLETIDLGWNTELTNRSISALLTNCRKLQTANLEGLKLITSEPFVKIITVPEALTQYVEGCMNEYSFARSLYTKLAEIPCLPQRSTVYCTELNLLQLKYSDYVEDETMQEVVAFSQGSLKVIGYYGEFLPESEAVMESFVQRLIKERWEKEEERRIANKTEF